MSHSGSGVSRAPAAGRVKYASTTPGISKHNIATIKYVAMVTERTVDWTKIGVHANVSMTVAATKPTPVHCTAGFADVGNVD